MPYFGPGEGPIFFHGLRCTGSENRLSDCSKSSSYNTYHSNDAGVRCQLNFSPGKFILQCHSFFTVPPGYKEGFLRQSHLTILVLLQDVSRIVFTNVVISLGLISWWALLTHLYIPKV